MKKVAKLSIIMIIMIFVLTINVYAKPSCNISMETKQVEVEKGKEITIDVNLSNIQSERGIIAIEAILEYEKDCLTLSKMEGQNGWHTPVKGLSYNESNGKFVIDKEGLAKSNETIIKITFVADKTSNRSTTVSLKNIVVADGTVPAKIVNVSKKITIKDVKEVIDANPIIGEEKNPISNEGQETHIETTPNKDKNVNNKKSTISEKQKLNEEQDLDKKQMTDKEQEENTNTIPDEEQEVNIIPDKGENTNQTTQDIDNNDNFTIKKNNKLIILLVVLLLVIIISGIIINEKRKNNKKKRRR